MLRMFIVSMVGDISNSVKTWYYWIIMRDRDVYIQHGNININS